MAHKEKEIFGQYASDNLTSRAVHDPFGTLKVRGDGNLGFHDSRTLFDEGYEESVGTHRTSGGEIRVVSEDSLPQTLGGRGLYFADYGDEEENPDEDQGRKKKKKKDEAYDWLRDHDPVHPEYTEKGRSKDA